MKRTSTAIESINRVMADIDARIADPEASWGITTGYKSIDERFLGFEKGKYLIICGPPHGCKTTLMLNMAYGMAKQGKTTVFVSMESTNDEIMERLLAAESGVPSHTLKNKFEIRKSELLSAVKSAAKRISEVVGDKLILISVSQQTSWQEIQNMIDEIRRSHNIDAILVDYLDVIEKSSNHPGRPDLDIGDLSIKLKSYASRTNVFLVTALCLNAPKDETSKFVSLEETGVPEKICIDADYILISLPKKTENYIDIVISKARNNSSGDIFRLEWHPNTGKITEYNNIYRNYQQEVKPDITCHKNRNDFRIRYKWQEKGYRQSRL